MHRCGKYPANAVVSRGSNLLIQYVVDGAAAGDLIQLLTGEQHSEADGDQYRGIIRAGSTFVEHPGAGIYVLRHTEAIVADSIQAVLHLKTLDLVQQLYGPGGEIAGAEQRPTGHIVPVDDFHFGGAGCADRKSTRLNSSHVRISYA